MCDTHLEPLALLFCQLQLADHIFQIIKIQRPKLFHVYGSMQRYPPQHLAYRSFFVAGRAFRQPAYLATSFSREVALRFLQRSTMAAKVLWIVRIDPVLKCVHVNLVTRSNVPGEQEYLFAPYSAFTVISAKWVVGTTADPHIIELSATPDNKAAPEDLALAPWS